MSTEPATISEEEAKKKAEKTLLFEIGNLPHLGSPERDDGDYVFPLLLSLPRVIFDEENEDPVDVRYLSDTGVGEIRVDAEEGEVTDRTNLVRIQKRIRRKEKEVDRAVQQALVKASAEKFSLLPFPEHRYTPIQDLLSEVILSGQITSEKLDGLDSDDRQKYEDYIENLVDANLLRWEEDRVTAADHLIEIEASTDSPSEALNAALAQFFEQGADNYDMIRQILGPYLTIAGYYYKRTLTTDEMPKVETREFREELKKDYTGKSRSRKSFKLSRYLLQLEAVEILESVSDRGGRSWEGREEVKAELLRQEEYLRPIAELIR